MACLLPFSLLVAVVGPTSRDVVVVVAAMPMPFLPDKLGPSILPVAAKAGEEALVVKPFPPASLLLPS